MIFNARKFSELSGLCLCLNNFACPLVILYVKGVLEDVEMAFRNVR
jgi:hypothetical protein